MLVKIEKILFYIFLFLIPFQIRYFVSWGGNEWNSIFFYLADGIFLLVLVLWVWRIIKDVEADKRRSIRGFTQRNIFLWLFLAIAGISLFLAGNLGVGIFRFVKLLEFGLLFLYLKVEADRRGSKRGLTRIRILQILIASGVIQSILAIGQFLKQGSLGLKFIEAGAYSPGAPGVATFIMENGEKIMRAYASFPHPNVLAAFLLLSIFLLYKKILSNKSLIIYHLSLIILIFALFLTFSRTVIVVFLVMSLVMFLFYLISRRWGKLSFPQEAKLLTLFGLFLLSIIISTAILFPYLKSRFFEISFEEQAIDLRFFYNKMALTMIKEKPILGIGIGNFVWHSQNYPAYLRAASKMMELEEVPSWIFQPVHNIYLLIAVEMGIIGLVIFIAILITNCIRMIRIDNPIFFLVICFLILGLADHYFWTLQSGGLMFWLALGLIHNS